jgi:hypothetical protein
MAHYALLDQDNTVVQVITGLDEGEQGIDWEEWYGQFHGMKCKRTSYNTKYGVHASGGTPFRGNYAGVGFVYDEDLDAFIPPKPYESWSFNVDSFDWSAPVPRPDEENLYLWDESTLSWVHLPATPE